MAGSSSCHAFERFPGGGEPLFVVAGVGGVSPDRRFRPDQRIKAGGAMGRGGDSVVAGSPHAYVNEDRKGVGKEAEAGDFRIGMREAKVEDRRFVPEHGGAEARYPYLRFHRAAASADEGTNAALRNRLWVAYQSRRRGDGDLFGLRFLVQSAFVGEVVDDKIGPEVGVHASSGRREGCVHRLDPIFIEWASCRYRGGRGGLESRFSRRSLIAGRCNWCQVAPVRGNFATAREACLSNAWPGPFRLLLAHAVLMFLVFDAVTMRLAFTRLDVAGAVRSLRSLAGKQGYGARGGPAAFFSADLRRGWERESS